MFSNLNQEEKEALIKTQKTLLKIDMKIPVFFNLVAYQNLGLITTKNRTKRDSAGNDMWIGTDYFLTPKAKILINTVI